MTRYAGAVLGVVFLAHAAMAQLIQQGSKLVGTGAVWGSHQGFSVAISGDGNIAIVGGPWDNSDAGAAWVFTRSRGVWSQQGSKLVGTGTVGPADQGWSVAISADGNTAIVGGWADNSDAGAAWVFTRSRGVWSQQGDKLVGTDTFAGARQGFSVAISADGNTAILGGPGNPIQIGSALTSPSDPSGAAWVFTRSGGVWSQQGSRLVGTGAVGYAFQGGSVAISADGNTAIVGGPWDNQKAGAAWLFTRSGGLWSQQGSKLVGTGAVGPAEQGGPVAISADGNTAIVGGHYDNGFGGFAVGAAWVYTRGGSVWSQQGNKLVGTGAVGSPQQGYWVAISADGNTALVGGPLDNSTAIMGVLSDTSDAGGAAWVFTRSGGVWAQQGSKLVGAGAVGAAFQGGSVAISGDATTAIVGGPSDDSGAGAAWVFSAPNFNGWVPVASHISGKNSSQWRSDLGLLNPGTAHANVSINFYGNGGVVSSTTYVSPGAQSILTDVVGQLNGSGSGALEIISDQPLKVTARSYNQVASGASCYAGGTQGQDYPAVASSDGLGAGPSAYLAGLSENSQYRSNIGVVNTGTGIATVLVELFDGSGAKLTEYTVALNPGDWKQETQPFLNKAGQTAMDRGYAKVTVQSGSGVFAFASVVDGVTNDPTTVTMQR